MKTYEQMAADALRRIEEHEAAVRNRRRTCRRTAVPAAALCIAMLLGLGIHRSGIIKRPAVPVSEETQEQLNETAESGKQTEDPLADGDVPAAVYSRENNGIDIPVPDEGQSDGSAEGNRPAEAMNPDPELSSSAGHGSYGETEPGVVEGAFLGPGEEPAVTVPALIEDYANAPEACYSSPAAGDVFLSEPLRCALEKYEGLKFRVVIDIFDGEDIIRDKERMLKEADRLYREGNVISAIETITNADGSSLTVFTIHATEEQIRNFKGDPGYGYFMWLYREYFRAQ